MVGATVESGFILKPFSLEINNREFAFQGFRLTEGDLVLLVETDEAPTVEVILTLSGLMEPLQQRLRPINQGLAPRILDPRPIVRGKIYLNGKDLLELSDQDRAKSVGVIFENADWGFLCSTVEEDFNYSFAAAGIDPPPPYNLRRYGLFDSRSVAPEFLSGGEQQRLACAGLIERSPRFVIADFSSSNVDQNFLTEVFFPWIVKEREQGAIFIVRGLEEELRNIATGFLKVHASKLQYSEMSNYRTPRGKSAALDALRGSLARRSSADGEPPILTSQAHIAEFAKVPVDVELHPGQPLLIVGPNGSGKTSFGRSLVIRKQSRGLTFGPRVVPHMALQSPERCIFRSTAIRELENCETLARICGLDHEMASLHPLSLNRSKQKLISVAAALKRSKVIAILDEPTAGMNWSDKARLSRLFDEFPGIALIIISHDKDLIEIWSDLNLASIDFGAAL